MKPGHALLKQYINSALRGFQEVGGEEGARRWEGRSQEMEGSTKDSDAERCSSELIRDLNSPVTLGRTRSPDTPAQGDVDSVLDISPALP